ncbi:23S rRNA (cytosine1962-C5)-methyltransferase [Mucilaginibacter gracilis]|uniref:23S rRNA (Cytosine1962-C5)-methyltransferase n=1 Tax=Mucilaginibacter gracilis TaxID=423350 RepID=A0A495J8R9_9SPHI|nr:class I SAM-dependent methyltransferase [Mucilaginibacter gracilis]RKR85081.1 23S rRNA (cytosine1962-C5)-methyltransferase [Mucilaginibacter gracilis]
MIQLLTPTHWKDYELIDCGSFEKLERFGNLILIRPEPQAVWNKGLSEAEWTKQHHIRFKGRSATSGEWVKKNTNLPDRWNIEYQNGDVKINLRMALTSFKHVGMFPEQAVNWDYISKHVKLFKTEQPRVLNLFAYTGGASLIAKAAGADTTHVDSIKQVVTWGNENMELSGLKDIRWVVEDALKFVKREVKRGKTYNGIILDPPAYGHGPNGEKWKLEDSLNEMMHDVVKLLDPEEHFLILNTYSLGFSSVIVQNLILSAFPKVQNLEIGELYLQATAGSKLPLGVFGKFFNHK